MQQMYAFELSRDRELWLNRIIAMNHWAYMAYILHYMHNTEMYMWGAQSVHALLQNRQSLGFPALHQ